MTYQRVFFPLWMGAGKVTSVPQGARDLRAALGAGLEVAVPESAALELESGIKGRGAILEALRAAAAALSPLEGVALLGGDCSSDFALLARSNARFAPDLAVIWLDTHADLNTAATSPSGHFHGQVLRAALGDASADFLELLPVSLEPRQVFLAGVRDFDPPELEFARAQAIPVFSPEMLRTDPSALARAVQAAGFSRVHVHLDLDVLDASEFSSTGFSSHGGLLVSEAKAVLEELKRRLEIVSFAVTEYAPQPSGDDLETVLGLIRVLEGTI